MTNKIKFSANYPKLWNQKTAYLIKVRLLEKGMIPHSDLIEYDTKDSDGNYYKLPINQDGKLTTDFMQLIFVGNKDIPFCTLRRYTPDKYLYYTTEEGEEFEIEITSPIGDKKK